MSFVWKLRCSSLALCAALATIGGCIPGPGDTGGGNERDSPEMAGALQDSVVTSTMVLSSRVFPTRALLPNTGEDTVDATPGGQIHLVAPAQVPGYALMFWHVPRGLSTGSTVDFTAPADASFYATAWYLPLGGCPGCPAPPPTVTTVAFSNDRDEVIADTPIAAVNVSGAWAGAPSTIVSTAGATPVAITAQPLLAGSGEFAAWLSLDGFAASGRTLTEPAHAVDLALALFATPSPDPCASARAQRDALDPAEFLTLAAYRHAVATFTAALHACETAHGEELD
jgi:hypothetical protein